MGYGDVNLYDTEKFYIMCRSEQDPMSFNICDSPINLFSKVVVESLDLDIFYYPYSYEFFHYNEKTRVTKQAKIAFSICAKYHDEILFDVANINQFYICLGKPWKSYRDV